MVRLLLVPSMGHRYSWVGESFDLEIIVRLDSMTPEIIVLAVCGGCAKSQRKDIV